MVTNTERRSASVFMNGRNQCVRIPKDFWFDEDVKRVEIVKVGNDVILRPMKKTSWRAFLAKGPNPDFQPNRTPIGNGDRFLALMEKAEKGKHEN